MSKKEVAASSETDTLEQTLAKKPKSQNTWRSLMGKEVKIKEANKEKEKRK